jgi:hypothetical protein
LIVQSLPTKLNNQTRASGHIDRTTVITPFQQAGSSSEGSVNKTSQPLGRDQQEKLAEVMSLTKQKKTSAAPYRVRGKRIDRVRTVSGSAGVVESPSAADADPWAALSPPLIE